MRYLHTTWMHGQYVLMTRRTILHEKFSVRSCANWQALRLSMATL